MFGFTNIQAYPFSAPVVWLPMVIGLAGIIWFVLRQFHTEKMFKAGKSSRLALLDLSVLRNRSFSIGTIIASLSFFAFSSLIVLIPLFIQDCRGYSATISGLVMLPGAIAQAISQFFGGRALDRFGARPVALIGTILLTAGTACMSTIGLHTWIWSISFYQFIRQIGMGFVMMPVTTWSLNCLKPSEVSAGSAVTNTVRQIAGAVGSPVMILIMYSITAASMSNGQQTIPANITGIEWALRISAVINFIMILMVVFGVKGEDAGSAREAVRIALHHDSIEQEDKGTKALAHTDDTAKLRTIETGK